MRLLIFVSFVACASAQFVTPVPAAMPAWLVPYPGVSAPNRQILKSAESSYSVAAPARDVLAHFRALFASAGLPFEPDAMGYGFVIRTPAPECDLDISIRRREPETSVKVTCSPRLAANEKMAKLQAEQRAEHTQDDPMKKFDSPVYPQPKTASPLTWPSWLVRVDGEKLSVSKYPGQLRSSFTSSPTREGIQAFYVGLLKAHDYRVTEGLAAVPEKFGSWVQGSAGDEAGRRVVWIKIKPAGQNFSVELSMQ